MNKKIAFVFPGQGSQSVGMLADLAKDFPLIEQTFTEASSILNYDLWSLVQQNPEDKLNQTEYTQPALLTASVAIWRIWQAKHKPIPNVLAGHSLGEYSALVCAQAFTLQDAVKLVANRGRFMQEAVADGEGAMAAIVGLENDVITTLCEQAAQGQVISPANFNSIGQTVVAGHAQAVDRLIELADAAGARLAKRIAISVPSHCSLMRPAAEKLAKCLQEIPLQSPKIPVVNNADVSIYNKPDDIRSALVRQLYSPVRWVETIQLFEREQINLILECGPGKILAGLNKRIVSNIPTLSMNTKNDIDAINPPRPPV